MAYENLAPGVYDGKLLSWSVEMVEQVKQPQLILNFEFKDQNAQTTRMAFKSFFKTRDGSDNKKTFKTLETIEFSGKKIQDLNDTKSDVVNSNKIYQITVGKNDKGYWNVEWVNDVSLVDKSAAQKSLAGYDFNSINGALAGLKRPAPRAVKNHAPGASSDDSIPF